MRRCAERGSCPRQLLENVMATLIKSDLEFILQQIMIAEQHAAGANLVDLLPNQFASLGLRTVDGSYNHLVPGQQFFGAADQPFPSLLDPAFLAAYAADPINGFTTVVDLQPRTISNLIVDQTVNNPAALAAAFVGAGLTEAEAIVATADIGAVNDLKIAILLMNTAITEFTAALSAPAAIVDAALLAQLASAHAAVTAAATSAAAAVAQLVFEPTRWRPAHCGRNRHRGSSC